MLKQTIKDYRIENTLKMIKFHCVKFMSIEVFWSINKLLVLSLFSNEITKCFIVPFLQINKV